MTPLGPWDPSYNRYVTSLWLTNYERGRRGEPLLGDFSGLRKTDFTIICLEHEKGLREYESQQDLGKNKLDPLGLFGKKP